MTSPELLASFWRYETALMANDVAELDELFIDNPETIRSDGGATLVGHDHIAAFRAGRKPVPPRRVERIHVVEVDDDNSMIIAESVRGGGGTGVQTQLWSQTERGWRIRVAHVSLAIPAEPPVLGPEELSSIWRVPPGDIAATGAPGGPLSGISIAVKDLFAVKGQRIGCGNPHLLAESTEQPAHAAALQQLLDAGATVAGIAQTDELAFSLAGTNMHYGTPPNVAAPGRITGGSTSGPAAAVAAGLADLGLGTDTAGSVRVPASYCGLYGLRPTHGRISVEDLVGLAPSFDTVGVLARTPQLLANAVSTLLPAGPDSRPAISGVTELLISPTITGLAQPDSQIATLAAIRALAGRMDLPVRTIEDDLSSDEVESWFAAFRTIQAAEAWHLHGAVIDRHRGNFEPAVEARFRNGAAVDHDHEAAARKILAEATVRLDSLLGGGAAIALPATAAPAPLITASAGEVESARAATLRLTSLASLAGLPVLVLPTARVGSLPLGLAIMGARDHDHQLLSLLPKDLG